MFYSSSVASCFARCLQMPYSLLHMLLQALQASYASTWRVVEQHGPQTSLSIVLKSVGGANTPCGLAGAPLSSMASDALLQLMELHILPPVPVLYTTWTTPFFGSNPILPTWLGPNLTAAKATTG